MKIITEKLVLIAKDGTEETIPMKIENWKAARNEAHEMAWKKNGIGSGYVLHGGLICGIMVTGPDEGQSVPRWEELDKLTEEEMVLHDRIWAVMDREAKTTYGPKDVADFLGISTASVRSKASKLAKNKAIRCAYKNSTGWQITPMGVSMMKKMPDGRKKK